MDPNARLILSDVEEAAVLPMLDACGVDAIDLKRGFVACPGEHLHRNETQPGHCLVYPNNGRPRLYCTHQSCKTEIDAANQKLSALRAKPTASESPAERQKRIKREAAEQQAQAILALRLKCALPDIVREHAWPHAEMVANSPVRDVPPVDHWRYLLLGLFRDDEVVWIGRDEMDSGPGHEWRFRPAFDWAREPACPGPYTCPHAFNPGTYSRSNDAVLEPRYLIVESDTLSKDEVGAIFRWLETKVALRLRAVVDTGSKSLHGWFDYPSSDLLADLKIILPLLRCDDKMFTLSQPCRLPGHANPKTGNMQVLLYLDADE